jgi:hypothetical protein
VPAADAFLRHLRFGRDGAESTTRAYAGAIALFLRWCERSGRDWQVGAAQLGSFMTWLAHAGPQVSGIDAAVGAVVLAGPGTAPARSARRVNAVLTAVHGMAVHAVTEGTAPGSLVRLLFEVADDLDLPDAARGVPMRPLCLRRLCPGCSTLAASRFPSYPVSRLTIFALQPPAHPTGPCFQGPVTREGVPPVSRRPPRGGKRVLKYPSRVYPDTPAWYSAYARPGSGPPGAPVPPAGGGLSHRDGRGHG